MKNGISISIVLLVLMGCQKQQEDFTQDLANTLGQSNKQAATSSRVGPAKIDICHYDADAKTYKIINVSERAWPDHKSHGDVRLDDADDDGFVPDNSCGFGDMGDCDDSDPNVFPGALEICENQIDDDCDGQIDEVDYNSDCYRQDAIDVNGKRIYVQPAGDPGFNESRNWNQSKAYCQNLVANGFSNWRLPTQDELVAMYDKRLIIGDFDTSGTPIPNVSLANTSWYWSSNGFNSGDNIIIVDFSSGTKYFPNQLYSLRCRCVRE